MAVLTRIIKDLIRKEKKQALLPSEKALYFPLFSHSFSFNLFYRLPWMGQVNGFRALAMWVSMLPEHNRVFGKMVRGVSWKN